MTSNAQNDTLIIKSTNDFELDGKGSSAAWDKAGWNVIPQRSNAGKVYQTKFKVLYSSTGIYFLFDCEDHIITSTMKEDFAKLYEEDVVEVFFWTDEDYPFYFEYEISPYNYELPIFVPNVKGDFFGWLPWQYEGAKRTRRATYINEVDGQVKGWIAEFFIPFALLKPMSNVPAKSGTKWRANLYRIDYDDGVSTWTWQPVRTNFHDYESFGVFIFE